MIRFFQGIHGRLRDREFLDTLAGGRHGDGLKLSNADAALLRREIRACVEARGGEASARDRAAKVGSSYLRLAERGRRAFAELVVDELGLDEDAVVETARAVAAVSDRRERRLLLDELRARLRPPWLKLFRQFNALPSGTKFLVDLRADLLRFADDDPSLEQVERDLKRLLASWFDIGFLELRRITWDSPASLLEKLATSEAVHTVADWGDLKNRLEPDRRFFALFHPRMNDEPLIFVEVALGRGLQAEIGPLLDPATAPVDPCDADTATFYSITSAQRGLAGISFGGFLIKHVVEELSSEFPRLKTFATLSPIPGFRRWLSERLAAGSITLEPGERDDLRALTREADLGPERLEPFRERLLRLCVDYLLEAKRAGGAALDPVAHFHLTNGARIERINWLADRSPAGLDTSLGMMVNYLYPLSEIEANHAQYVDGNSIAVSRAVSSLARPRAPRVVVVRRGDWHVVESVSTEPVS
jgi:malonyl-CoA decarboxylase